MNRISRLFVILLALPGFSAGLAGLAAGEMASTNYNLPATVMDSTGMEKSSDNYKLLDAVGQGTPIGVSEGGNSVLQAGFIYQTGFTLSVKDAAGRVIAGLEDLLKDATIVLTSQERKSINQAIQALEDAMKGYDLYEAGDLDALANSLNRTKSAIDKLLATSADTARYQEMLAQAAELAVESEINRVAALAGDNNPAVLEAKSTHAEGSAELRLAEYRLSVLSFVQAYNQVLLAV